MRTLALILMLTATGCAAAETCMVSPTQKQQVSGRFGKFREGGAANFGSGNPRPHMHDGLDFSTSGVAAPIMATTDGTVTWAGGRGRGTGNVVMIRRDSGEIVTYYHLSVIEVQAGQTVAAGQEIGRSGATGMLPGGAVHLHFIYGVPEADDAREKAFSADAHKNLVFLPAQLPNALTKKTFGYATDPSPYFCQTFPIQSDGLQTILGADTMAQYTKLFDGAVPMGVNNSTKFDATAVAAANGDALQAAAKGATSLASAMTDADGYGALPTPPLGDYETLSPAEMMSYEARRRFSDSEWNQELPKVSVRALWTDYAKQEGVATYLEHAIHQKKERVEALLAVYTSQRLGILRRQTEAAQQRALRDDVTASIKP